MVGKILKAVLVLLGFGAASCEVHTIFGGTDAYGCPTTRYIVKGRVVDAENKPIKDIKVSLVNNNDSREGGYYEELHSVQTDANGNFSVDGGVIPSLDNNIQLSITDIDGEENGGLFSDKVVDMTFDKDDMTDKSTWVTTYKKDVGDIDLDKSL